MKKIICLAMTLILVFSVPGARAAQDESAVLPFKKQQALLTLFSAHVRYDELRAFDVTSDMSGAFARVCRGSAEELYFVPDPAQSGGRSRVRRLGSGFPSSAQGRILEPSSQPAQNILYYQVSWEQEGTPYFSLYAYPAKPEFTPPPLCQAARGTLFFDEEGAFTYQPERRGPTYPLYVRYDTHNPLDPLPDSLQGIPVECGGVPVAPGQLNEYGGAYDKVNARLLREFGPQGAKVTGILYRGSYFMRESFAVNVLVTKGDAQVRRCLILPLEPGAALDVDSADWLTGEAVANGSPFTFYTPIFSGKYGPSFWTVQHDKNENSNVSAHPLESLRSEKPDETILRYTYNADSTPPKGFWLTGPVSSVEREEENADGKKVPVVSGGATLWYQIAGAEPVQLAQDVACDTWKTVQLSSNEDDRLLWISYGQGPTRRLWLFTLSGAVLLDGSPLPQGEILTSQTIINTIYGTEYVDDGLVYRIEIDGEPMLFELFADPDTGKLMEFGGAPMTLEELHNEPRNQAAYNLILNGLEQRYPSAEINAVSLCKHGTIDVNALIPLIHINFNIILPDGTTTARYATISGRAPLIPETEKEACKKAGVVNPTQLTAPGHIPPNSGAFDVYLPTVF